MWNKRDEASPAAPGIRPAAIEPPPQQNSAASPAPDGRELPKSPAPNAPAAIGASMVIKGDIFSREELQVDGEVEGKVELQQRLTVGPRAKVRADIKARELVISGEVHGNVEVLEKTTIHRHGSLIGDIKTAGIVIDDGAYFKGSIDIVKSAPVAKAENSPLVHTAKG